MIRTERTLAKKKRVLTKHYKGYKILLAKAYFDQGFGLTGYVKYLIALFGISSLNVKSTLIIAFFYAIACYIIGRLYWKYKLKETEIEIQNSVNPFVEEMREKI